MTNPHPRSRADSVLDLTVEALAEFAEAMGCTTADIMRAWQPALDKLSRERREREKATNNE